MEAIRYALAHCINHSNMDVRSLTEQELMDLFAILPDPAVSFESWLDKVTPKKSKEELNSEALRNLELMQNNRG